LVFRALFFFVRSPRGSGCGREIATVFRVETIMDRTEKLRLRGEAIASAMRELSDKAAEENRPFTEEEQASYDEHGSELDQVKAAIEREKHLRELERGLIPLESRETPQVAGEAVEVSAIDRRQAEADSKTWDGPAPFGSMLQAVIKAATQHPSDRDKRLVPSSAITGLGESVSSEGGFLVTQDVASSLIRRTYESSQIINGGAGYAGVSKIPIGPNSKGTKIPAVNETSRVNGSRWGGVQAYWAEEGGTLTGSKPDFREIDLTLKKLIGLCYATDELLEDAVALEAVIMQAFAEEFAFKVQDALINGTGAGHPLGILNSPCLVTVTRNTASTIKKADIDGMYARMWARARASSVWHINQDCEPQLLSLVDAGSNSVYLPPGGMAERPYGTLLGRPVIPIEQCQTMGTSGDIYLCGWPEYLYCDKGAMKQASSIHVSFTTDQTCFRFVYRADGQPAWNSALTPFKGSNTLSPFVALT
jgi:HK97 family phage major capsid protein